METKNPKSYKEIEEAVLNAVREKLPSLGINEPGGLAILGITMIGIQDDLQGIVIGNQTIPTVVAVGNNSGRIYQFALKALIPGLDI